MAKKKKVLFIATVDSHILAFHLPYLELFKQKGWETHVATNGTEKIPFCDHKHTICMERSPYKLNNLKAIKQMKKLLEKEHFDIIHCHTPMGSVVTRLAAKKARKKGTRVIYTAHGFHFYTGAPLINWLLFYPVEWYLAKYTDTLITINHEDYNRAKKKFSKHCHDIQYVPGVGIDPKKFDFKMTKKEKHELRASLGLKDDDFVMIFPAELSKRKNQMWLIKTLKPLLKKREDIHLLLPGLDNLGGKCQRLTRKLRMQKQIHFLGFRNDIPKLLTISDLAISSAKQEGLPVNILEAATLNKKIISIRCRGTEDILGNNYDGLIKKGEQELFREKIAKITSSKASQYIPIEKYLLNNIKQRLVSIYFKKKTILHLLSSNIYSGAENVACTIINELKNEYELYYCSPRGDIEKKLQERKIKYIPIKKNNIVELKKVIKTIKPDLIHAHDVRSSVYASMIYRGTLISHIHGNHLFMRKVTPQSILYLIMSKKFYKIIWVSESSYQNYRFKKTVSRKSIVMRNIIDEKYIHKKASSTNDKKIYDILFLGRLMEAKNPMRAIKIMEKIIRNRPKTRCVIAGDGTLSEQVRTYIQKNKLTDNIKMLGNLENPYTVLAKSRVLLMTSVHEGTPMVALEALSFGVPIISTPIDGLLELVNSQNGFLSNDDNKIEKEIIKYIDKSDSNLRTISQKISKISSTSIT